MLPTFRSIEEITEHISKIMGFFIHDASTPMAVSITISKMTEKYITPSVDT